MSVYGIALNHAPSSWKSPGSENRLHAVRLCNFQAGGAWNWAIPCCCKVAVIRGKCGLGKVANMDWHEISECAIKNATIRPGSQNSKIATWASSTRVKHRARQCCHHQPSVAPVARAPGALVPPYSGSERPWGACNAAAPPPARGDTPGAQVCVLRARPKKKKR